MRNLIVGIDCAVSDRNIGVAYAWAGTNACHVFALEAGQMAQAPGRRIADVLRRSSRALLALDAPLGWPAALGPSLTRHRAGAPLDELPNRLFRRETDRQIRTRLGKQPLDVGADRIARTAHRALALLDEVRMHLGRPIPLAWSPVFDHAVAAIEVYPAATLLVRDLPASGYKGRRGSAVRRAILSGLAGELSLAELTVRPEDNDHALDALICVLAGFDFLRGRAVGPDDLALAQTEGWIWA